MGQTLSLRYVLDTLLPEGTAVDGEVETYVTKWQSSDGFTQAFIDTLDWEINVYANQVIETVYPNYLLDPSLTALHQSNQQAADTWLQRALAAANLAHTYAQQAANKVVSDLLASGFLLPDPSESNRLQRIQLIGHSRGAGVNALVASELTRRGYTIDQYTALDGVGTDWPVGSGQYTIGSILGDVNITQAVAAGHMANYEVDSPLGAYLLDFPGLGSLLRGYVISRTGGIFDPFQIEDTVLNGLRTLPIQAPDRTGFETQYSLSHDHTTITRDFINALASRGPVFLESTLGRSNDLPDSESFAPTKGVPVGLPSSWGVPRFSDNALGSTTFDVLDGTFERTASLLEASAGVDLSGLPDEDTRNLMSRLLSPGLVLHDVWGATGDVRVVASGSGHAIELVQTADTSIGQFVGFGPSPSSLSFDMDVLAAGPSDRLVISIGDEVIASLPMEAGQGAARCVVPLAGLGGSYGTLTFQVTGPQDDPADVRLDNLWIAQEGQQVSPPPMTPVHIGQGLSYSLDPSAVGQVTPLTLTQEGVSATISAVLPAGPEVLEAVVTGDSGLAPGPAVVLRESEDESGGTVRIDFSRPVAELRSLVFATGESSVLGSEVVLEAYRGDQLVATQTARGGIRYGGRVPEGTLSLREGMFDSLRLHVNAPGVSLAVSDFEVSVLPPGAALPVITIDPIATDNLTRLTSVTVAGQLQSTADLIPTGIFSLDGSGPTAFTIAPGAVAASGRFSIPLSGLSEGVHTLVLHVSDQQGNVSDTSVTFNVDLTGPGLTVNPVGIGGLVGSGTLSVTGSVSDTLKVGSSVAYRVDGGPSTSTLVAVAADGLSGTFTLALAGLNPGPHTLTIQGFDQAGNSVETTVPIVYDAAPPTVVMTFGRDAFVNVTDPVLTGAVSDIYGVNASST